MAGEGKPLLSRPHGEGQYNKYFCHAPHPISSASLSVSTIHKEMAWNIHRSLPIAFLTDSSSSDESRLDSVAFRARGWTTSEPEVVPDDVIAQRKAG